MSDERSMWPTTISEWVNTQALLRVMREGSTEEVSAVEVTLNEFVAVLDFRKQERPTD